MYFYQLLVDCASETSHIYNGSYLFIELLTVS